MSWVNAIADPALYGEETALHDLLRRLRAERPVAWCEPPGFEPFWAISTYADIAEISRQDQIFISGRRIILFDLDAESRFREEARRAQQRRMIHALPHMDGDIHRAHRRLTQGWFMPKQIRDLEPQIRRLARAEVKRMCGLGDRCDVVEDLALRYPLRVLMLILGVPARHEAMMLQLTQEQFAPAETDLGRQDGAGASVLKALLSSRRFFQALTRTRRVSPNGDLASVIATARLDGAPLGDMETFSYYNLIATAGHDTTSSTLAAGFLALCRHPDQLDKLRSNPELIPAAVEEMIRWASPVRHFMRTAMQDVEMGSQTIRAGQSVMLLYPSGNRDAAVFTDPDAFRIDRTPNRHLGFGLGAHACLGLHLARLELRIMFEELIASTRNWRQDAPAEWVASSFVGGPKVLRVAFDPA